MVKEGQMSAKCVEIIKNYESVRGELQSMELENKRLKL